MRREKEKKFIKRILRRIGNYYNYKVGIELTLKCNLKCKFCYLGEKRNKSQELSKEVLFDLADEISEANILLVLFLGGEPLLRRDFFEVYEYFYKKGFFISIHTNGTLINKEVIRLFKKYPPYWILISLYGASESTYRKVTGDAEAFRKILNGMDLLKKEKLRFKLIFLLTKYALNDIKNKKMQKIIDRCQVPYFINTAKLITGVTTSSKYRVSFEDLNRMHKLSLRFKKAIIEAEERLEKRKVDKCPGYLFVDSQKRVRFCQILEKPAYSLSKWNFKKLLDILKETEIKLNCPCY